LAGASNRTEYLVRFSSPGHEDLIVQIRTRISGWFFGSILVGGIGVVVDGTTGAMWKLEIKICWTLSRNSTSSLGVELLIFDINDIPDE